MRSHHRGKDQEKQVRVQVNHLNAKPLPRNSSSFVQSIGDSHQMGTAKLHRKHKGKQRLMKIVRLLQPQLRINFKPRWKLQIQQLEENYPNNT
jgi:hypothetical protein